MGKLHLDIVDSSFNQKMSVEYELLIHISPDYIQYLIHDSRMHVLTLKSYELEVTTENNIGAGIRAVYIQDKNLSFSYKKILISVDSKAYTLIPGALYSASDDHSYLAQVTEIQEDQFVFSNFLPKVEIRNIAAIDKSIAAALSNYFGEIQMYHSLSPLISGYRYIAQNKTGRQLFINFHLRMAQVVLFDNKDLVYTNQFNFQTTQDFLYFLMLVFDQFNLDQEEVPVLISGLLLEKSEIYQAMYKYIRHIGFVQLPAHLNFSVDFQAVNHHYYFDLYSLTLCE